MKKPSNLDDIINRYQSGVPLIHLGRELGVKGETVGRWISNAGVQLRSVADSRQRRRLEIRFGEKITSDIIRRYSSGESLNVLACEFGVSRGGVTGDGKCFGLYGMLQRLGVAVRDQSAAEKMKWSLMSNPTRTRQTKAARIVATQNRRYNWLNVSPSECLLAGGLVALGENIKQQFPVGLYNVDIAFEELRVAVEIESTATMSPCHFPRFKERLKELLNFDWRVVYVLVNDGLVEVRPVSQHLIALVQQIRRSEPMNGQYGMLSRDGQPCTVRGLDLDSFTRISGF